MSIVSKARARGAFKRPDIRSFIPEGMEDVVARVSAAGQKIMYSPDMRDELQAEVKRDAPVAQKMAESVVGLMLTLDAQTEGGIPEAALCPAGLDLLGEAAEVLSQAGEPVTTAEYNEAAQLMFIMMAKKLGHSDEQIMGAAEQAVAGAGGAEPGQAGEPPPEAMPPEEGTAPPPDDEEAEMQRGFQ